jgi:hypothetical protein
VTLTRRRLFGLAAGAGAGLLVPEPVRRYFILGDPARRILEPTRAEVWDMLMRTGVIPALLGNRQVYAVLPLPREERVRLVRHLAGPGVTFSLTEPSPASR